MFNVVLVEPEIPNNTGNIGRTCVGTGATLHLVGPLGFEISDRQLKRAGLDYWPHLNWKYHENWDSWWPHVTNPQRVFFFSTKASRPYFAQKFVAGDWLVFGKETRGLPEAVLAEFPEQALTIPMFGPVRSLNLANCVSAVLFEGVRQVRFAP